MTNNKYKIGDEVFENKRYYSEGRSQFGSSLKRFNSKKITSITEISGAENPIFFTLENGMLINEIFCSKEAFNDK